MIISLKIWVGLSSTICWMLLVSIVFLTLSGFNWCILCTRYGLSKYFAQWLGEVRQNVMARMCFLFPSYHINIKFSLWCPWLWTSTIPDILIVIVHYCLSARCPLIWKLSLEPSDIFQNITALFIKITRTHPFMYWKLWSVTFNVHLQTDLQLSAPFQPRFVGDIISGMK